MSSSLSPNLKRKDLELDHLVDAALDFTLSSPACKIRRLDADLPPVTVRGEPDRPLPFEQEQQSQSEFCFADVGESRFTELVVEELPTDENQERAIVLFKPINTPLFQSPSSFVVDSNLISSLKDRIAWEINSESSRPAEEKGSNEDEQLAVIPWVSSQRLHQVHPSEVSEMELSEPMDAEEMGATMEAEENIMGAGAQSTREYNQSTWTSTESLPPQQWQHQHCIIPQPPHNTTSPIVWYR